jgi:hypothetical protein
LILGRGVVYGVTIVPKMSVLPNANSVLCGQSRFGAGGAIGSPSTMLFQKASNGTVDCVPHVVPDRYRMIVRGPKTWL